MATNVIYTVNSTDDSTSFAIQPRTIDGAGGVQQSSDLTLYGNATPQWGELFNENFYHLNENWAVEQKLPSDAGYNALLPTPRDNTDLGSLTVTLGINVPVIGQTWYNKTNGHLYVYEGQFYNQWYNTADLISTGTAGNNPPNPLDGQLYYNTTSKQIEVYDLLTASWVETTSGFLETSGGTMTGHITLYTGTDPTGDQAISVDYADENYVNLTGDDMSGRLQVVTNSPPYAFGPGSVAQIQTWAENTFNGPSIQQTWVAAYDRNDPDGWTPLASAAGTFQPTYEAYTPGNDPTLPGTQAPGEDTHDILRITQRPGYALNIQTDLNFKGGADCNPATTSAVDVLTIPQGTSTGLASGALYFYGTPNLGPAAPENWGLIVCPNAPDAVDWSGFYEPKVLATKEYVDLSTASASSVTPIFVPRWQFRTSGGTTGWTTVNATGHGVPGDGSAKAIMIQYYWSMTGPDSGDFTADVNVREGVVNFDSYKVTRGRASGGGDGIASGSMGIYPISAAGTFQYEIQYPGFGALNLAVCGYFA